MKQSESRTAILGAPTAFTGEEWGVKRRFEFLFGLTSLKDTVILDVGCGAGAYGKFALKHGASSVVGLDLNQKYFKKQTAEEKVQASGIRLPFKDSSFNVVFMIEVLEHLPSEQKALNEAKRVLKQGGLLFITVPNKFYPFETHGMKLGSTFINNILGIGIPFLSWMPQVLRNRIETSRIYTQKTLTRLLYNEHLTPLQIDYMTPPLDVAQNQEIVRALRSVLSDIESTCFRYFGCHILILAKST
jgi:ubiquinone/menaquinone biosynthesis C-methylase UbiE